eukprot:2961573-Pleurochrysis_carterae.AAC.1
MGSEDGHRECCRAFCTQMSHAVSRVKLSCEGQKRSCEGQKGSCEGQKGSCAPVVAILDPPCGSNALVHLASRAGVAASARRSGQRSKGGGGGRARPPRRASARGAALYLLAL